LDKFLKEHVACPKWRSIFAQNVYKTHSGKNDWKFDLAFINKNM
jgi:hypothetical protein